MDMLRAEFRFPVACQETEDNAVAKFDEDPCSSSDQLEGHFDTIGVERSKNFHRSSFRKAWQYVARMYGPFLQESRVLDDWEEVWSQMDPHTSPGYPFVLKYPDKQSLYDDYLKFEEICQRYWDRLETDPYSYVALSLKKELRAAIKVLQKKMRGFTPVSIDRLAAGIKMFGDLHEKFYRCHDYTFSTVGSTPFRGQWNERIRSLKSEWCYNFDAQNWDVNMIVETFWMIGLFKWSCLRDQDRTVENRRRIMALQMNIVFGLLVLGNGDVYAKNQGNNSGGDATIVDNTLANTAVVAYCYIRKCADMGIAASYEDFRSRVHAWLCGDDDNLFLHQNDPFLSAMEFATYAGELGVSLTAPSTDLRHVSDTEYNSLFTCLDPMTDMYVPYPDGIKVLASALAGGGVFEHSLEHTMERLAGLELQAFWTHLPEAKYRRADAYTVLVKCRQYLFEKYPETKKYVHLFKDRETLRRLYLNTE